MSAARSPAAGAPLLASLSSPLGSGRRRGPVPFQPYAIHGARSVWASMNQSHVVGTLVCIWMVWLLGMLLLTAHPSLLDPLVKRHEFAERAAMLAHEPDGPRHHHGLPGSVERTHADHHHQPAQASSGKSKIRELAKRTAVSANDAASAAVIEATPTPPRTVLELRGATLTGPGTRTTPAGSSPCSSGGATAHSPFEQYVLDANPVLGAADDFTSDQAPLRQLEVRSVHPTRAVYEWGPTTKQRGVLVWMCTSDREDVAQLMQSLQAIESSFTSQYDYPLAVFHEDYSPELMDQIQAAAPRSFVYFVKIRFQLPAALKPLEAQGVQTVRHKIPNPEHPTGFHEHPHGLRPYVKRAERYPYGYQHMCRFFSGAGFMLPFFDSFDWYWRLDSDTVCSGRSEHDVFDHLASCGLEYSHLSPMFGDGGDVVEGLWQAAQNFTAQEGIRGTWMENHPLFSDWGEKGLFSVVPSFNTNCEVASLAFLRSARVQRFHRYLDSLGGHFLHRWGDAPVRFLGVSMSMPESKTEGLKGIQCMHN